jgi:hypothetical protein
MSERRRISSEGPSPLQRLKDLPDEEQEFLIEQRQELEVKQVIAQIEARHKIFGLSQSRWSDFVAWYREREALRAANASVSNMRAIYSTTELTPEAVHQHCVDLLRTAGITDKDFKTLRFVTTEVRKVMELSHSREKFEFSAAEVALKCLPALRRIQADKSLDDKSRVTEARKALFGVTPE